MDGSPAECGKGVTATVVHLLAERAVLDYESPIAAYWPQFAVRGKERITVRHVLTHSAGVPRLPNGTTVADVCDWNRICRIVAGLEPSGNREPSSGTTASRSAGFSERSFAVSTDALSAR